VESLLEMVDDALTGAALGFRARRIKVLRKSGEIKTGFKAVALGSIVISPCSPLSALVSEAYSP
jgi:hypothetical protein